MNQEKLAKLISIVLGPLGWSPILLIIFALKTGLSIHQIKILCPVILTAQLIPLAYLYFAPKFGWAKAWDLPNKKERYPFFLILFIINAVSLTAIYFLGTQLLFNLIAILFILMLITIIISYFWKISLHVSLNTFGSILVNFLFDWKLPYLYLTIPLVFWARLTLKRHTFYQLIAPIVIDILFIFVSLRVLQYI